jgi:cytoskeletal protein RodZ
LRNRADASASVKLDHFGAFLKRGREARGLSLGELSRATKIKERSLELIEAAALDALPAPVFVRGFVSAYAREVGVDVARALELLKQRLPERDPPLPALPDPPPPVDHPHEAGALDGRRRVGVALLVLLILVVATLTLSLLLRHGRAGDGISQRALGVDDVNV